MAENHGLYPHFHLLGHSLVPGVDAREPSWNILHDSDLGSGVPSISVQPRLLGEAKTVAEFQTDPLPKSEVPGGQVRRPMDGSSSVGLRFVFPRLA